MIRNDLMKIRLRTSFLYSFDSLKAGDKEHYALCKMNDTLGPSPINTDPFMDDIRKRLQKFQPKKILFL